MLLSPTLLSVLQLPISSTVQDGCTSLSSVVSIPNTVITNAARFPPGSNTDVVESCHTHGPPQTNSADICRVKGVITTSSTSKVDFEMWLPDIWYGRFLVTGNGGLGGCVDYASLDHGSYLHFATIGTNNGHNGDLNASAFLMPEKNETVKDFSHRAVHVAARVGKKITSIYYRSDPHHSYYNGCSAGGRQGISVASRYPEDFDGIIAGSPGIDWNNLLGAPAIWASHFAFEARSYIPPALWNDVVGKEILKQCDGLDGLDDNIIADPEACHWDPTTLLCTDKDVHDPSKCLIQPQVDGLKKLYEPILAPDGDLLFSRFDPGAECDPLSALWMSRLIPDFTEIWYQNAIYMNPNRSLDNFSVADLVIAGALDPVGISTWRNALTGLAEFKNKGGKLLTFHGTRDPVIPSGQSKRFYELLAYFFSSSTRQGSITGDEMDEFYRLFMVPGMGHCTGGLGAWKIGQGALVGRGTDGPINQTDHSVMLSIVDWVEGGKAPNVIIGTTDDKPPVERTHCMWPSSKTVWNGKEWVCESVQEL